MEEMGRRFENSVSRLLSLNRDNDHNVEYIHQFQDHSKYFKIWIIFANIFLLLENFRNFTISDIFKKCIFVIIQAAYLYAYVYFISLFFLYKEF